MFLQDWEQLFLISPIAIHNSLLTTHNQRVPRMEHHIKWFSIINKHSPREISIFCFQQLFQQLESQSHKTDFITLGYFTSHTNISRSNFISLEKKKKECYAIASSFNFFFFSIPSQITDQNNKISSDRVRFLPDACCNAGGVTSSRVTAGNADALYRRWRFIVVVLFWSRGT